MKAIVTLLTLSALAIVMGYGVGQISRWDRSMFDQLNAKVSHALDVRRH